MAVMEEPAEEEPEYEDCEEGDEGCECEEEPTEEGRLLFGE
jgi:hypothetical protein